MTQKRRTPGGKTGCRACTVYVPDEFIPQIDAEAKALGWSRSDIMLHHLAVAYGRPEADPLPHYNAAKTALEQLDMTA